MKEKDNQLRVLIVGLILCLAGLIFQSWVSTKTASIDYVNEKCLDVKNQVERDQNRIEQRLILLDSKTDEILKLMINNEKK